MMAGKIVPIHFESTAVIAGAIKDQKLAAIMTPAVKPKAISKNFLFVDLKKKTKAAPQAVSIQVKSPAYNAIKIGLFCCSKTLKLNSIDFPIDKI